MPTARYRANASVAGMKYGEIVEIDDSQHHWQQLIDRGYLELAYDVEQPDALPPITEAPRRPVDLDDIEGARRAAGD